VPIFEFHCEKCNRDFEFLVLGKGQVTCPHCKSKKGKFTSSAGSECGSCSSTSCGP